MVNKSSLKDTRKVKVYTYKDKSFTERSLPHAISATEGKRTGFSQFAKKNVVSVRLDSPIDMDALADFDWSIVTRVKFVDSMTSYDDIVCKTEFEGTDELEGEDYSHEKYWAEVGKVDNGMVTTMNIYRSKKSSQDKLKVDCALCITRKLLTEEERMEEQKYLAERQAKLDERNALIKEEDDLLSSLLEDCDD